MRKATIQRQAGNPIIAKATKIVPGRWTRAKKWVKAHKKEIYLTVGGIASLATIYLFSRRQINKMHEELSKKNIEAVRMAAMAGETMGRNMEANINLLADTAKNQAAQHAEHNILHHRIEAVEKTMNDPRFREYLKQKHGITDLQKFGG